ncbi:S53 family peptidase [Actinospica sp.]|jgi:subtilase family serine protease|uniref:S53 family peptidase n=1 Tax=Actinospica sp. TaxID=1872142 RepID=UPI002C779A85|nr:S53 family peptidase [Actinospica sp.]HWG25239.1 S53 family peptidase [Actinospica sp.]
MPRFIPTLALAVTAAAGLGAIPALTSVAGAVTPTASSSTHVAASAANWAHGNAIRNDSKSHRIGATANAAPSGFGPSSIQSAYKLPSSTAGSGRTVAIVDAFNDPTAGKDLAVYRSTYGLSACTKATGCLKIVSQTGSTTSLPKTNAGWATEESLDLDMVSATCPNCHIILVEATSASNANLGKAVNEAAKLGADAISNSYGGSESSSDPTYDTTYYDHPGIAITASSGDSGYGVEYPAASPYVTAVGGTSLSKASNTRGWTETAWSGAGAGCSAYEAKPSFQGSASTGCAKRAVADVSAVADPNTGVAVYDTTPYQGFSGWQVYGGTSVASPLIASVYALAGNTSSVDNASLAYTNHTSLFDVTSGSDGSCSPSQLCTARAGWDGPTGYGTPDGVAAF